MNPIQDLLNKTKPGGQSYVNQTPAYSPVPSTQYVAPQTTVQTTTPQVSQPVANSRIGALDPTTASNLAVERAKLTADYNAKMAGNTPGYTANVTANSTSPYAYNGGQSESDKAFNDSGYGNNIVVPTQQDAYQNQLAMYQAEIDAANRVYNDMLAKTRVENANRTGSSGARQARGGLLGSERGAAIDTQTQQFNLGEEQSVENQRQAAIGAILGKARSDAAQEIKDKQAAKKEGYEATIKHIGEKETRMNNYLATQVQAMLAAGTDPNTIPKDELDAIAKSYGKTSADIISAYKAAKSADDKAKLETQKTQSEIDNAGYYTLGEGQTRYDAKGNVISNNPKASTVTTAGGPYVPGQNPAVDSWAAAIYNGTAKITDIPATDKGLRSSVITALQSQGNNLDGRPTTTEIGKSIITSANNLLKKFDDRKGTSSVGGSRILGGSLAFPGTDKSNFVNEFNTLKSQLQLDASKLLKGQGQVSDAERAILQAASTRLNLSQTETEFRQTLSDIVSKLEGNNVDANGLNTQDNATIQQMRKDNPGIPDSVIEQVIGKPLSLSNVGGDTNTASNIASAIKQTESGGNYNAVGDAGTSKGAYQFQPASWSGWSQKYLGKANLPMTPENQDAVAIARIQDLLNQGYDARQIALIWNGGEPVEKKGFNKKIGLAYDSGAYADKVLKNLT